MGLEINIPELAKMLKMLEAVQGKLNKHMPDVQTDEFLPNDRLVRIAEAGKILGVGASTIALYVRQGLLQPFFTPYGGGQQKFWVSHLHKLAMTKPPKKPVE